MLLINHPLDCPICDQAGECRLQDYWLEHQRKGKRMRQEPVHKPKAVVFGPTIVYDAERCIVCTRCVRFTTDVAEGVRRGGQDDRFAVGGDYHLRRGRRNLWRDADRPMTTGTPTKRRMAPP